MRWLVYKSNTWMLSVRRWRRMWVTEKKIRSRRCRMNVTWRRHGFYQTAAEFLSKACVSSDQILNVNVTWHRDSLYGEEEQNCKFSSKSISPYRVSRRDFKIARDGRRQAKGTIIICMILVFGHKNHANRQFLTKTEDKNFCARLDEFGGHV